MERFIPYQKLSKRERKARNAERRVSWSMNPVTRKPPNPKAYNRRKARTGIRNASSVSFLFYFIIFFTVSSRLRIWYFTRKATSLYSGALCFSSSRMGIM